MKGEERWEGVEGRGGRDKGKWIEGWGVVGSG